MSKTMTVTENAERFFSISAVERDTGLSKDTLRVWERRYSFPLPGRDAHGERAYSREQVEQLRVIKRLLDLGHRPGKIVGKPLAALVELAEPLPTDPPRQMGDRLQEILDLVRQHRVNELRLELGQTLMRQGLGRFLMDTVAPLNIAIGEAWMRGRLEIFEEHLYTETLQGVLRNAIGSIPSQGQHPRVLLTTFPNEQHNLGLLMAEAMFALEGATCISLGTQTPIFDIVLAAQSHRTDVVALSFSAAYPTTQVTDGLEELRSKIPAEVAIWVGGTNAAFARRALPGITVLGGLQDIGSAVSGWRSARSR
jgi:DNA-binding transcriptional MerR regulator/methylmalonyl-CoA mutase cobalamin-binding subunit